MARIFFILTTIAVIPFSIAAFPSNVHEMMTSDEIFQTFGTNDVPEYQVFPMTLPGTRRRRETEDENIYLGVEINGKEIDLYLKPTDGHLATRHTPIWTAVTDERAYNNIRYDPQPTVMAELRDFKMYQDVDNEAAIVVYTDDKEDFIGTGIITSEYILKSLPRRVSNKTLKIGDNFLFRDEKIYKRSIEPDEESVTDFFVLFKAPTSTNDIYSALPPSHREKRRTPFIKGARTIPEFVYPEILLVLDHNAIRNQTISEALVYMLAFWNGVDMIFSPLGIPKIRLNIAGIIISVDDAATPYIGSDTSLMAQKNGEMITSNIGNYFYKEQTRFPLKSYDIIYAMTTMKLCDRQVDPCHHFIGAVNSYSACQSTDQVQNDRTVNSTVISSYNWMFGGVSIAAHEIAHILGAEHDSNENPRANCAWTKGFTMAPRPDIDHQSFKFSSCSKQFFRNYFSSNDSRCFNNKPLSTEPIDILLPGRWLTLDGQCQNEGFDEWCQIPNFSLCYIKGCRSNKSTECLVSRYTTLLGTECGENEYCTLNRQCREEITSTVTSNNDDFINNKVEK